MPADKIFLSSHHFEAAVSEELGFFFSLSISDYDLQEPAMLEAVLKVYLIVNHKNFEN